MMRSINSNNTIQLITSWLRKLSPFLFVAAILWIRGPIPEVNHHSNNNNGLIISKLNNIDDGVIHNNIIEPEPEMNLDNNTSNNEITTINEQTSSPTTWCDKSLRLLPRTLKNITLLASYPGSGNTWMRHLIQSGSRVLTGSAYNDTSLAIEFPGEGRKDGSVVIVKTHYPCFACWRVPSTNAPVTEDQSGKRSYVLANAAIVIVRNPFDAILSEFNRIFSGFNHTGVVSSKEIWNSGPKGLFTSFVRKRTISWLRHTTFYLSKRIISNNTVLIPWRDENGKISLIMYYEQFKQQPAQYLQAIFNFLKNRRRKELAKLDSSLATQCALIESVGGFRRTSNLKKVIKSSRDDPYSQIFEDPPPIQPPDAMDTWNWRGPTRSQKIGETLREMMCRYFESVWNKDVWGDCLLLER
jgi:hypothetical protein